MADFVTLVHEKNPETIAQYPQGELSPTRQKSVFSLLEHHLPERIAIGNRTQALWKMHFSMQCFELYNFCSKANLYKPWPGDRKIDKRRKTGFFTVFTV